MRVGGRQLGAAFVTVAFVRPLLTAVGGKVAFLHLRMAGELGTSPVGIQPKF